MYVHQHYPKKPKMQQVDKILLLNQVNIALRPLFEKHAGKTFQRLIEACESPIEVILGATLLHYNEMDQTAFRNGRLALAKNFHDASPFAMIPQFNWREFRIDFCIIVRDFNFMLFIECDGSDFHNLDDEQRQKDRSRESAFSDAGIKCLRFTGKEIHAYAIGCALAVNHALNDSCRTEI